MASLGLKWGTIKSWEGMNDHQIALLQKWGDLGVCMSAMCQENTEEQKRIICKVIDTLNEEEDELWNDWDGKDYTKEEAKKYIMEYGKNDE